jgi:Fe-Mn family superoxide dismutase
MFTLIPLPYGLDALDPVISARTLTFHHGKHLQAYVDNLNKLLPGSGLEGLPLEEIVHRSASAIAASLPAPTGNLQSIFNNAGQVLNHNMYFEQFKAPSPVMPDQIGHPGPTAVMPGPTGHLKTQIEAQWGTLEAFQAEFVAKGVGLFGSGWVWLSAAEDGSLVITQEPGASNPLCHVMPDSAHDTVMPDPIGHLKPLLTFDVWEHAYYLDYQNRRADQLKSLWKILDWAVIEERYK